jgi:Predicted membrane protein (DUF2207) N-terminal domain
MTLPLALARPAAAATYYDIPRLQMSVRVLDDGVLEVTEDVTYQFVGSHTSREHLLKWPEGASLSQLEVGERESAYRQGGGTDLNRAADPGTFGVETAGWRDALRVVWHFRATDESRTFRFTYRLHQVTVAHADVAEVAMWLWNPTDARGFADRVEAELELPGPADGTRFRVWALPGYLRPRPEVSLGDAGAQLSYPYTGYAHSQNPTLLRLRAVFPRSLLATTSGARVADDVAFDRIVREETEAAAPSRDWSWPARSWPWWSWLVGLAVVIGWPVLVVARMARRRRPW